MSFTFTNGLRCLRYRIDLEVGAPPGTFQLSNRYHAELTRKYSVFLFDYLIEACYR